MWVALWVPRVTWVRLQWPPSARRWAGWKAGAGSPGNTAAEKISLEMSYSFMGAPHSWGSTARSSCWAFSAELLAKVTKSTVSLSWALSEIVRSTAQGTWFTRQA